MTLRLRIRHQRPGFALDVALQLPASGVSALIGPSGCGETSLLRSIAGLERGQGQVRLGEQVWQDDATGQWLPTHRRALGYVFQEASLFAHLNVQGNLHTSACSAPRWRGARWPWTRWSICWALAICCNAPAPPCPAASASAWPLPGRWPPARSSC